MSASNFEKSLHQNFGSLISGNILPMIKFVKSVNLESLTESDLSKREAYLGRFVTKDFPEHHDLPDFIQDLLQVYYHYWHTVLMQVSSVASAEDSLRESLNSLLLKYGQIDTDMQPIDEVEKITISYGAELGYGILLDVTLPYRECMIWRSQTEKLYQVNLHDTNSSMKVIFLDDFISFGWIGFASFNKFHAGGWAKSDAVYRVGAPPEDESDEKFNIDILCHEGRHFSDYIYFPKLQQPELEYRGKLTELCFARETLLHRIQNFINTSSPNKESAPHMIAAHYVIRDLSLALFSTPTPPSIEAWQALNKELIAAAATNILDQNNAWLKKNQPEEIESFLGEFEFQAPATV